jgi:hypothetical protein
MHAATLGTLPYTPARSHVGELGRHLHPGPFHLRDELGVLGHLCGPGLLGQSSSHTSSPATRPAAYGCGKRTRSAMLERDYLASDEVTQELSRTENMFGLLESDRVDRHLL